MEEYTYELTKKFPFVKQRPLTNIEKVERRADEVWGVMLAIAPIIFLAWLYCFLIGLKNYMIRRIKNLYGG